MKGIQQNADRGHLSGTGRWARLQVVFMYFIFAHLNFLVFQQGTCIICEIKYIVNGKTKPQ